MDGLIVICGLPDTYRCWNHVQIMELKLATLDTVGKHMIHGKETIAVGDGRAQQQPMDIQPKPFISLLNLVGEIYQVRLCKFALCMMD